MVQKLLQGARKKIQVLRNKLKFPVVEPVMALDVAQVDKEKEILTKELMERNNEVGFLKELNISLQQKLDTHVCTILVQLDSKDPIDKLTRVMIELKISEDEMKKM